MEKRNQINSTLESLASFEKFFKENYHASCLVALRYLKNQQATEDLVQDTFLYLWEKRKQLTVQTNLKQYLFQAVRNRSINYIQRERIFHEILTDQTEWQDESNSNDFSQEELAVQISKSIDNLPPQCKKIFLLAYIDNLTYKEIAEKLQLSKNTIKTQMGIAYKMLRQRLKSYIITLFVVPIRRIFR